MKTGTSFDRIQVRNLPTGRRAFLIRETLRTIAQIATEPDLQEPEQARLNGLATLCTNANTHCGLCSELERRYAAGPTIASSTDPQHVPVDREADHLVASIRDSAQVFVTRLKPHEPEYKTALSFIANTFPHGVPYITHVTYPEQLQRMHTLIAYCLGDGAEAVATLGLTLWVNKLKNLLPTYEEVIQHLPSDAVRFAQVRACQQEGHLHLRQIISHILTAFPLNNDRDEALRKRLLAPLEHQEAQAAAKLKRSAVISDVDPDTGAEVAPLVAPSVDDSAH